MATAATTQAARTPPRKRPAARKPKPVGRLVGCARVSTAEQDPALQLDALELAGCSRVFTDHASGSREDRPELAARAVSRSPGRRGSLPCITATTVNDRDQLTAPTANGTPTTAGYLDELQTDLVSATTGNTTTTYQNTLLGLTSSTAAGATTSYVRTPAGRLITADTGTGHSYYLTDLTDLTGSTVATVSSTGTKTAAYAYDPYGRTRTATGTNATTNPFRFDGGLYNPTTGTIKFGARYYDPATGRFTQPDPSGQETNPYAYVGDDPINGTDPTGESALDIVLGAAGLVATGLGVAAAFTPPGLLVDSLVAGGILLGVPASTVGFACVITGC